MQPSVPVITTQLKTISFASAESRCHQMLSPSRGARVLTSTIPGCRVSVILSQRKPLAEWQCLSLTILCHILMSSYVPSVLHNSLAAISSLQTGFVSPQLLSHTAACKGPSPFWSLKIGLWIQRPRQTLVGPFGKTVGAPVSSGQGTRGIALSLGGLFVALDAQSTSPVNLLRVAKWLLSVLTF